MTVGNPELAVVPGAASEAEGGEQSFAILRHIHVISIKADFDRTT
jgi:hypothetical protein